MQSSQKDRKRKRHNVLNLNNRYDDKDNFVVTIDQMDDYINSLDNADSRFDHNIIDNNNCNNNNTNNSNNNNDNNTNNKSSSSSSTTKRKKRKKKDKDKSTNIMTIDISDDNAVNREVIYTHALPPSTSSTQVSSSSMISDDHTYPYKVVNDDHCETPLEAYKDIDDIIATYAISIGKQRSDVSIYDPYYCEGSMIERLHTLGYRDIYNKKEDFYEMISLDRIPPYDVLVTNPPYSMDHMVQLLRFVMKSSKPWFLLLPNYVYCKDYYQDLFLHSTTTTTSSSSRHTAFVATSRVNVNTATSNTDTTTTTNTHTNNTNRKGSHSNIARNVFYVTPIKGRRYLYTTPKGRRQEKSAKYTSPFPTFWYCHLPHKTAVLSRVLVNTIGHDKDKGGDDVKINVAHSTTMIPIEVGDCLITMIIMLIRL
jgi:hypothetical protein